MHHSLLPRNTLQLRVSQQIKDSFHESENFGGQSWG